MTSSTTPHARTIAIAIAVVFASPALGFAAAEGPDVFPVIDAPLTGAAITRGETTSFAASVTDVDCPLASALWDWGNGEILFAPVSNPSVVDYAYAAGSPLGAYTVTFTATGECGASKSATISIELGNAAPVAAFEAESVVIVNAPTAFNATSSSDDGSIASYLWTIDGVAQPSQAEPTLAWTFTAAGTYAIELVVVDDLGAQSAPATASIDVVLGPLARIDISGPATVGSGETVIFVSTGYDALDNVLFTRDVEYTGAVDLGADTVCDTEADITGCLDIEVIIGPLAIVRASALQTTININRPTTVSAKGFDINEHEIEGLVFTWTTNRGVVTPAGRFNSTTFGLATVTATVGGVSGSVNVRITPTLPTTITIAPATELADAATEGVSGSVHVSFIDGPPAAGAKAKVFFQDPVGATSNFVEVTTDANGDATFTSPLQFLPGEYVVSVASTHEPNYGAAVDTYVLYVVDPGVL